MHTLCTREEAPERALPGFIKQAASRPKPRGTICGLGRAHFFAVPVPCYRCYPRDIMIIGKEERTQKEGTKSRWLVAAVMASRDAEKAKIKAAALAAEKADLERQLKENDGRLRNLNADAEDLETELEEFWSKQDPAVRQKKEAMESRLLTEVRTQREQKASGDGCSCALCSWNSSKARKRRTKRWRTRCRERRSRPCSKRRVDACT